MSKLRTVRGQSARITQDGNGLFHIELYANGEWGFPVSGYDGKFKTNTAAEEFFAENKNCIHG